MPQLNFWLKLKKPFFCLAPMAGLSDSPFRLLCKKMEADVVYTEMVSVTGLFYQNQKTLDFLKFNKKEKPVVLQLFGSNPQHFEKAAQLIEKAGFDGVDINLGCPAKKIVNNYSGVALMDNLDLAYEIIKITCQATRLPVSIKIRNQKNDTTALDLIQKIKNLPVQAIMLHARSFKQGFAGPPDWSYFKKIRSIYNGILIANGGIETPEIAKKILITTQADGLGLARGTWGRPWLFKQIKDYLDTNNYNQPNWSEIKKIILIHAQLFLKTNSNLIPLRQHLLYYIKNQPHAKQLRQKLIEVETLKQLEEILNKK
ncbi:MAG: tRNA-dihydrouridine synthase [Patescibacteria group bacterium]|nr:tRNA-dihydrouridine synthase [Patescibacteria group bacterium]